MEFGTIVHALRWKAVAGGLLLLVGLWLGTGAATTDAAMRGDPAALGFSPAALAAIDRELEADIEDGLHPGAALAIVRHDRLVHFRSYGRRTPDSDEPMPDDAIYRIYSMTKPIVSLAAMQLVEAGKLAFDAPLARYLPAFRDMRVHEDGGDVPARRPITIADLLRHTSGLTYDLSGNGAVHQRYRQLNLRSADRSSAEFTALIAALPLVHHPGEVWEYSMSVDVLGRVIEVVSGQTLGDYQRTHIFEPLGMHDTGFHVPAAKAGRVAEPNPGVALLVATDPPRFQRGGGGLLSTMADYLRFCRMLARGGEVDGKRVIGADTLALMTRDHLDGARGQPAVGYGFGYGFAVRTAPGTATLPGNIGDYWWAGYAGTYFWIDPVADLIVVYMMQSPQQRRPYRIWLRHAVYGAMTE